MRPARRLLILTLLAAQMVVACDCESMLAKRRREGAPTSSEGRAWDEPAAISTRAPAPVRAPAARVESVVIPPAPQPVRAEAPAAPAEEPLSEATRQLLTTRPRGRGFDRLRPVKLPRNIMPAKRFGGDPVEEQAAEPHELLDR